MKKLLLFWLFAVSTAFGYQDNPQSAYKDGYANGLRYTATWDLSHFSELTEAEVKETAGVRAFRNDYLWENVARKAFIKGWLEGYLSNYSLAIRRGN